MNTNNQEEKTMISSSCDKTTVFDGGTEEKSVKSGSACEEHTIISNSKSSGKSAKGGSGVGAKAAVIGGGMAAVAVGGAAIHAANAAETDNFRETAFREAENSAAARSADVQEDAPNIVINEDLLEDDVEISLSDDIDISTSYQPAEGCLQVAENVSDDMSFSQAFAAARHEVGPGGIFHWHGKSYGTYYKEEWDQMSADEKDDYFAAVNRTEDDYNDYLAQQEEAEPLFLEEPVQTVFSTDEIIPIDVDGDGMADIALVDANGNDMVDVLADIDGDGQLDLILDPVDVLAAELYEPSPMEELPISPSDDFSNDEIDYTADINWDPNLPIDSNMNVDDLV